MAVTSAVKISGRDSPRSAYTQAAGHEVAWDEDWIWGGPTLGDMEIAISALRQAADNAEALEMWRTDAERWHLGEPDPLLLAAEVLSRLHVIEPVAHVPKGLTNRWALVQLRALFTAGTPDNAPIRCAHAAVVASPRSR